MKRFGKVQWVEEKISTCDSWHVRARLGKLVCAVVEHGFNNHLTEDVTPEALSVMLSDLKKEHEATESTQFWADFYAERLAEKLP